MQQLNFISGFVCVLASNPGFLYWILSHSCGEKSGTGFEATQPSLIHRLSSSRTRLSQTKLSANHFQYCDMCAGWGLGMRPVSGKGLQYYCDTQMAKEEALNLKCVLLPKYKTVNN